MKIHNVDMEMATGNRVFFDGGQDCWSIFTGLGTSLNDFVQPLNGHEFGFSPVCVLNIISISIPKLEQYITFVKMIYYLFYNDILPILQ